MRWARGGGGILGVPLVAGPAAQWALVVADSAEVGPVPVGSAAGGRGGDGPDPLCAGAVVKPGGRDGGGGPRAGVSANGSWGSV